MKLLLCKMTIIPHVQANFLCLWRKTFQFLSMNEVNFRDIWVWSLLCFHFIHSFFKSKDRVNRNNLVWILVNISPASVQKAVESKVISEQSKCALHLYRVVEVQVEPMLSRNNFAVCSRFSKWWAVSRTVSLPLCWFVPGCAMWLRPSGATRVHEHEAPGGCRWGCLYCWLTLFSPESTN